MPKGKDPPRTFAQRLDSIEAKIRQLTVEKDRALKRFNKKFGDNAPAIHALQQKIRQTLDAERNADEISVKGYSYKDGELTLWGIEPFSDEVYAMYEQLRELRGDMRRVHWEPGWVCECGNTTSIWFDPVGRKRYSIICESCWTSVGSGGEEEMFQEVDRDLAKDVTSWSERNSLRLPHHMFVKGIAERLGVKIEDLPPYIGMRGRTPEYYIEKLKDLPRQIAERQAEDEEDLPEVEKEIRRMQRIAIGKN